MALVDGRRHVLVQEGGVGLVVAAAGALGGRRGAVLALLAHGLWDTLHRPGPDPRLLPVGTIMPPWYPVFCASYDLTLAALLLTRRAARVTA